MVNTWLSLQPIFRLSLYLVGQSGLGDVSGRLLPPFICAHSTSPSLTSLKCPQTDDGRQSPERVKSTYRLVPADSQSLLDTHDFNTHTAMCYHKVNFLRFSHTCRKINNSVKHITNCIVANGTPNLYGKEKSMYFSHSVLEALHCIKGSIL